MGCDIHAHVEVRIGNVWHHYSVPRLGRNYDMFSLMANVRNSGNITPISPPKGLPPLLSQLTAFDALRWGPDGHSHSWLSASEMKRVEEYVLKEQFEGKYTEFYLWYMKCLGPIFGYTFGDFITYSEEIKEIGIDDARLVFWFDN
jgi:hypothetical protein